jgi:hypothetical protein
LSLADGQRQCLFWAFFRSPAQNSAASSRYDVESFCFTCGPLSEGLRSLCANLLRCRRTDARKR